MTTLRATIALLGKTPKNNALAGFGDRVRGACAEGLILPAE
jgi:hypothetical protein